MNGGEDAALPTGLIDHVGASGDGVVLGASRLHIARTLPGETVRFRAGDAPGRAELADIVTPSPDRVPPPCPHFSEGCGGCALQHWRDDATAAWKRGLLVSALGRAGFPPDCVAALVRTPPGTRRRMEFAVRRGPASLSFGLHRAHGGEIIDLHVCPVLDPALEALLTPLRALLSGLGALRRDGSVLANLVGGGADLLIRTDGPLTASDRGKLAAFAGTVRVARISWARGMDLPETAAMLTRPIVRFAGRTVAPPPGAFLQASAEGEAAIVQAVLAGLPARLTRRSHAVELFAGIGTLSFPLGHHLRVLAYEGDARAVAAMRSAQAGSRVEVTERDLARRPLSQKELRGAAVVVLDPPYAGAEAQCALIAAAGVPRVIYVSCNPGALARDATVLAASGYTLLRATPIDQFVWSSQVECVAVFEKTSAIRLPARHDASGESA